MISFFSDCVISSNLAPVDSLARSLGIAWRDAQDRRNVAGALRRIEVSRDADGRPRAEGDLFHKTVDEIVSQVPNARRPQVERAVTSHSARQQGVDHRTLIQSGRRMFKEVHNVLSAEARRAEAQAELGRMRAAARAEARARTERMRQMGIEEEEKAR